MNVPTLNHHYNAFFSIHTLVEPKMKIEKNHMNNFKSLPFTIYFVSAPKGIETILKQRYPRDKPKNCNLADV